MSRAEVDAQPAITVASAVDVPWADLELVFGTRGDPARCWCQYFKLSRAGFDAADAPFFASALKEQVRRNDPSPGLIAYLDGEPAGWVAVEPRRNYPTLLHSTVVAGAVSEAPDDPSVWAIVCFVVPIRFRRRGISTALARAAADWATSHGARVIEGYPVDVALRPKASSADLYHGTVSAFAAAGFELVARPTPTRAVMRREVADARSEGPSTIVDS